jgi:hypothetical protein
MPPHAPETRKLAPEKYLQALPMLKVLLGAFSALRLHLLFDLSWLTPYLKMYRFAQFPAPSARPFKPAAFPDVSHQLKQ